MSEKQLPTLQPGDSHMESLIEAAIQGHASTRDAMRWLVRQLVPATQPAEVTHEEVMRAAKDATAPEWQDVADGWHMGMDLMAFARAILALRPERVPMTQLPEGDVTYFDGRGDAVDGYTAGRVWEILRSHGITAQGAQEGV